MRKLAALVAALFMSTPALAAKNKGVAQKKTGLRLKVTQNLFDIQNDWTIVDNDPSEKARTQTIGLLNPQAGRTEVTYLLGSGLEVGGIVGLQQQATSFDGTDLTSALQWQVGVTGAYNIKVADFGKAFIQPIVGIGRQTVTDEDANVDTLTKALFFGGAAGMRIKLFKRVTADPQLEYIQQNFTYEVDGTAVENSEGRQSNLGLKWGLTVLI